MKASFKGPMVAVATFVLATGASSLALAQQHTTENPAAPPAGAAQQAEMICKKYAEVAAKDDVTMIRSGAKS